MCLEWALVSAWMVSVGQMRLRQGWAESKLAGFGFHPVLLPSHRACRPAKLSRIVGTFPVLSRQSPSSTDSANHAF